MDNSVNGISGATGTTQGVETVSTDTTTIDGLSQGTVKPPRVDTSDTSDIRTTPASADLKDLSTVDKPLSDATTKLLNQMSQLPGVSTDVDTKPTDSTGTQSSTGVPSDSPSTGSSPNVNPGPPPVPPMPPFDENFMQVMVIFFHNVSHNSSISLTQFMQIQNSMRDVYEGQLKGVEEKIEAMVERIRLSSVGKNPEIPNYVRVISSFKGEFDKCEQHLKNPRLSESFVKDISAGLKTVRDSLDKLEKINAEAFAKNKNFIA
ncbi:MAG: hypothetical protein HQL01_02550 [Nitrospirae bacterium]|nr:hypothetical protein [Nitrospirota bacterium]